MAGRKRGDNSYSFLHQSSQDLNCAVCKYIAQDPQQTTCDCTQLYCKTCLQEQKNKSKFCPTCNKNLSAFPDRLSAKRIDAMREDTEHAMALGDQIESYQPDKQKMGNVSTDTAEEMSLIRFAGGTENSDDVIMLYLPCLIICTMIVCIVSSAFALGHV